MQLTTLSGLHGSANRQGENLQIQQNLKIFKRKEKSASSQRRLPRQVPTTHFKMASINRESSNARDLAVEATISAALGAPEMLAAYRAGVGAYLQQAEQANVLDDVRSLEFEAEIRRRVTGALRLAGAGWGSLTQFNADSLRLLLGTLDNCQADLRQIWRLEAAGRTIELYESGEGLFVRHSGGGSWPMADQGNDPGQEEPVEGEEGSEGEGEVVEEAEEEGETASEREGSQDEPSVSAGGEDGADTRATATGGPRPWVCHVCIRHRGVMHKSSLVRHMKMVHNDFGFVPAEQ
ncbi:hypothetical protein HRR90_003027 [Exophiala dermatitidis]|nr:hypothetical protein HRR90_003027 [Exophiala dermatitidis]